jgi:hypothetical protein
MKAAMLPLTALTVVGASTTWGLEDIVGKSWVGIGNNAGTNDDTYYMQLNFTSSCDLESNLSQCG